MMDRIRINIYWKTSDVGIIDRIRKRFGISAGISRNGETVTDIDEGLLCEMEELETHGLISFNVIGGELPHEYNKMKCPECGRVFMYERSDIHSDQREGCRVLCPTCKKYIIVDCRW